MGLPHTQPLLILTLLQFEPVAVAQRRQMDKSFRIHFKKINKGKSVRRLYSEGGDRSLAKHPPEAMAIVEGAMKQPTIREEALTGSDVHVL